MVCNRLQSIVVGLCPKSQDKVVIIYRPSGGNQATLGQFDTGYLGHTELQVALVAQDRPHRIRDLARSQAGCGNLVQQRLE